MADQTEVADFDDDEIADAFAAVCYEKLNNRQGRVLRRRLERNGPLTRLCMRRAADKFAEEGGDVGDVQAFLDWLIKNWPAILEMIKSIIALFAVV